MNYLVFVGGVIAFSLTGVFMLPIFSFAWKTLRGQKGQKLQIWIVVCAAFFGASGYWLLFLS